MINLIRTVEFTEKRLIIVKDTIDKLFFQVNNVKELFQTLYTEFVDDDEIKDIITDLVYSAEAFKGLSRGDYDEVINENIKKINDYKQHEIQRKLQEQYRSIKDDDTEEALMYQMQLREQLSRSKQELEIINE